MELIDLDMGVMEVSVGGREGGWRMEEILAAHEILPLGISRQET